jgi:apolipoprotein N-acyltransferase
MDKRNRPGSGQVLVQKGRPAAEQHGQPAFGLLVPSRPRPPWAVPLLAAAATGFLLYLAHFNDLLLWLCGRPTGLGWLGWVALVPVLGLVRMDLSTRRTWLVGWVAGLLFFVPAIQWMRVADYRMYATWLGLSLYCSLFVPTGLCLVRRLDRRTRLPLVLTVPAVWTALDYFRAHFLTGFPWYFLGYTQHDLPAVIQVADLAGVYAVTFLVAAVNAFLFDCLYALRRVRTALRLREPGPSGRPWKLVAQGAAVALLLGAALAYGHVRLSPGGVTPGPRVALVQGNLDQRIRNEASGPDGDAAAREMVGHFATLSNRAALQQPRPDLIVWPETSYPDTWVEAPAGQPSPDSRQLTQEVARLWATNVLLGLNAQDQQPDGRWRRYNSALLITADGRAAGRYDKIHRVPFGEFVPFRDWLPWMNQFAPYDFDYSISSGAGQPRLPLGGCHFGVLICYEDTDPYLARQYARPGDGGPAADFLLNISNDGWFNGTSEHEEHLAMCRLRAVESRRAVARAVNMGISAVIDGSGRVLRPEVVRPGTWEVRDPGAAELPVAEWGRFKKVPGVLTAAVPLDQRHSLYAHWGDWLPQACWILLGAGCLWPLRARFIPRTPGPSDLEREAER